MYITFDYNIYVLELFYIFFMNENDTTHNSEINATIAFTQSLAATLKAHSKYMTLFMKPTTILILTILLISKNTFGQSSTSKIDTSVQKVDKTIFVCGASIDKVYIKYVVELTKKIRPKICYIPTAVYDDPLEIIQWYENCSTLNVIPTVLKTYVESDPKQQTFEEQLLDCEAIFVCGGSTLNMLAIWKAQGIDTVLRKAYDKGIILAGGSAGSLCWFTGGFTDSRPKYLSQIDCLGFLNYSHCPHFGNADRKTLYEGAILNHKLKEGYACDNLAGLLFVNGALKKSISQNKDNNNYFISVKDGKINEELLPAEIIK
jgi:dipeptidase E